MNSIAGETPNQKKYKSTGLTERELQILIESARPNYQNSVAKHVADVLDIRPHIVRHHNSNIRQKLAVTDEFAAVYKVLDTGILILDKILAPSEFSELEAKITGLTRREQEVLALAPGCIETGKFDREYVASRLDVSRATAANHIQNLYHKLGISNRAQLALVAYVHNINECGAAVLKAIARLDYSGSEISRVCETHRLTYDQFWERMVKSFNRLQSWDICAAVYTALRNGAGISETDLGDKTTVQEFKAKIKSMGDGAQMTLSAIASSLREQRFFDIDYIAKRMVLPIGNAMWEVRQVYENLGIHNDAHLGVAAYLYGQRDRPS